MSNDDRQLRICELLRLRGEVDYRTLADSFAVSEMTIRRDVDALEQKGLLRKVMGGAIALGKLAEPPFEARASRQIESKQHIAEAAADYLRAHETVILDSGSTALAVARAVRGRELGLTIVTPSILVAVELANERDTTVILTGGLVRPGELSLIGFEAVQSLGAINCDTFVMGVAGVHDERGYTDYHRDESAVKRAAISACDRLIVVADHSKIGRVHLSHIAPLDRADVLVTDETGDLASATLAAAARVGVEVATPPPHDGASRVAGGSQAST